MSTPARALQSEDVATQRAVEKFSHWATLFLQGWEYPLLKHAWVHACLLTAIAGICATRAYIGINVSQAFTHDAFMLLDGAWRMVNGQRPHLDFYSHVGVLSFAPTAVGMWLARGSASAFGYGQALVGVVLGLWSYLLCRNRLADVPAVLMSLSITLMAAAPACLGFPPLLVEPAMTYNRAGYAVLALIFVDAAAEWPQSRKRNDLLGGLSTGLALGTLLFLKVTYFVFAVLLVLALAAIRSQRKDRWKGIAIGFGATLVTAALYFRFNLKPMVMDLVTVAAAKHFRLDWYEIDVILEVAAILLVLSTMGAVVLFLSNNWLAARSLGVTGLAICIIGIALLLGNYEQNGFPLAAFLAILVANAMIVAVSRRTYSSDILRAFVLLLSSVFVLVFLGISALNFPYGIAAKILKAGHFTHFDSARLMPFVPVDGDEGYTLWVNQGLALVRQYALAGETVMSLDFTNPFSYSLGLKPAPGGATVIQYKTTFDEKHGQSAQSLFGSADLVMMPNEGYFSDPTLAYSVPRIYGPYLKDHFRLVAKSKAWSLYRRSTHGAGQLTPVNDTGNTE